MERQVSKWAIIEKESTTTAIIRLLTFSLNTLSLKELQAIKKALENGFNGKEPTVQGLEKGFNSEEPTVQGFIAMVGQLIANALRCDEEQKMEPKKAA